MSEFLGRMYYLEDDVSWSAAESPEDLQQMRDDLASELRSLGEEQTEKRDNMPEGLQDSESGTLLEERAEACENIATELDDVDLDYDEPDEDEIRAEIREDAEEETDENIEARKQAKLEEWLDEKRSELENVSWDYS